MELGSSFYLELRNVGRSISDEGWEDVDLSHIEYWKLAQSYLSNRTMTWNDSAINISVDWQPVILRLRERYKAMERVYLAQKDERYKQDYGFPKGTTKLTVSTKFDSPPDTPKYEYISISCCESFLYDFFLIMNLAAPGSCDFYSASLVGGKGFPIEISLSSNFFESSLLRGMDGKWPKIHNISLENTAIWYFEVRSGASQVPKSRMEKVLFALLHIAKGDLSPATIIWIFYALETLFDTSAGENFRALRERLKLLLSPTDAEFRFISKNLRELYNLRSSFVHGGLEVAHPMQDEILSPEISDKYYHLMDMSDFGFSILLSSIQSVIGKGWLCPNFDEVLSGTPLQR